MTDPEAQPSNPWWHPDELLTPGTSALVAFVLSVLVLMGSTLMVSAVVTLLGQSPALESDWGNIWATAVALLIPGLGSAVLAHRAITAVGVASWELILGRAALVLAVLGIGYTAILTLGSVIQLA